MEETYKSRVYTDRPAYADFDAPAKFQAIQSIIAKHLKQHPKAICSYSGGADSDIMIDVIERTREIFSLPPVKYVFFNTGLEMQATKDHVKATSEKYGVKIETFRPKVNIVRASRTYGIPFVSKIMSAGLSEWQKKGIPLSIAEEYDQAEDKAAKRKELKQDIMERYGVKVVRPLADNTMRRVIRGVDKFTIRSGKPFLVSMNAANLIQYHTEQTENVRASGMGVPINTVDASNRYGLTCANLVEYYGNGVPLDISEPMHTVTSHDREALTVAHIVEFKGQDIGQSVTAPLRTITASAGEFAECRVALSKACGNLGHWPEIRDLLNRHCGYHLADDEVILLMIRGIAYYIADITLRMLTPRELYNAMGFPPDYIIDHDYMGNAYGKTKQVARCGNAVCPPLAEAMVRANLPEWCGEKITTMDGLNNAVAV